MSDCIFCKIVKGDFNTEFLYEDELVLAFNDLAPQAPVHVLIIPKIHFENVREMTDDALVGRLITAANKVADELNIQEYRLVINTGKEAGQTVFHTHLHLLGGRPMTWPPG